MSLIKLVKKDTNAEDEKARITRLRQQYIDSNKEVGKVLTSVLHDMADAKRPEYERSIANWEISHAESFIKSRNLFRKNATIYEFNQKPPQNLGESHEDYKFRCDHRLTFNTDIVLALTDHPIKDDKWESNTNRPAFVINLKPDADAIALRRAKEQVEVIVRQFIFKVMSKVIDILVVKPEYQASLLSSSYTPGALEADIKLAFKDGTGFSTHLIVKTNYRYGHPYIQYPMTFHKVVLDKTSNPVALASQYEIMSAWGIPAWKPASTGKGTKPRRRWDTVKSNCVIMTTDNLVALVERIAVPKDSKLQVKAWNKKLEELEETYNRNRSNDHDAFTAYHTFKYKTLPALKLGLMKAFVRYADGRTDILDHEDILYIAAKLDYVNTESFYHDELKKPLDQVSLGYVVCEHLDGERERVKIGGTHVSSLSEWMALSYSKQPKLLRELAFKAVASEMVPE